MDKQREGVFDLHCQLLRVSASIGRYDDMPPEEVDNEEYLALMLKQEELRAALAQATTTTSERT